MPSYPVGDDRVQPRPDHARRRAAPEPQPAAAPGGDGSTPAGRPCWSWRTCARARPTPTWPAGSGSAPRTVFRYIREALDVLAALAPTLEPGDRGRPRQGVRHPRRHAAAHRPGRHGRRPGPALLLGKAQVPRGERAGHRRPRRPADLGLTRAARRPPRHGRRPRARHHRRPRPPPACTRWPTPATRAPARRSRCRSAAAALDPDTGRYRRLSRARRRSTPPTPACAGRASAPTPS